MDVNLDPIAGTYNYLSFVWRENLIKTKHIFVRRKHHGPRVSWNFQEACKPAEIFQQLGGNCMFSLCHAHVSWWIHTLWFPECHMGSLLEAMWQWKLTIKITEWRDC